MRPKPLWFEDHPDDLTFIQRILQPERYNLIEARTGVQGLSNAERHDITLPDMDGYKIVRRLRASQITRLSHTPIIAITANALKGAA